MTTWNKEENFVHILNMALGLFYAGELLLQAGPRREQRYPVRILHSCRGKKPCLMDWFVPISCVRV